MQYFLTAMQILRWIVEHRDDLVEMIKTIESLIPEMPGNEKAAAVRNAIGTALSIETQIDKAWPLVAPIFNLLVKDVKAVKQTTKT